MSARSTRGVLALLLLPAGACTFEPGAPFAEIRPQLSVSFVAREDRVVDARWQKLASGLEVRVTRATAQLTSVQLLASAEGGSAGAGTFDPARPPAGYSLCHNGHCHADDGRLVPYEQVAAGAGGGGPLPVLTFAAGDPFDLLLEGPGFRPLPCPEGGGCAVDRRQISRLTAAVQSLHIEGEVRTGEGTGVPEGLAAYSFDLTSTADRPLVTLQTAIDLPADNQHPPLVDLLVAVGIGTELFDRVAWNDLTGADGTASLTGGGTAATAGRMALLEGLQLAEMGGQVRRSNR